MEREQLIAEALRLPMSAIEYQVSQRLAAGYPDRALVEGDDRLFNVEEYARAGHCTLERPAAVHNQTTTRWRGPRHGFAGPATHMLGGLPLLPPQATDDSGGSVADQTLNGWSTVTWEGSTFDVVVMNWLSAMGPIFHFWILAGSAEIARAFLVAVCEWNLEVRGEILVFEFGHWRKDPDLFRAIRGATWDNLVLRGALKEEIRDDLSQFFTSRATYEDYGIPWKRGILFVGPPGNGKTHAVKALFNALDRPCLYVRTFRAEPYPDDLNIRRVFDRVRKSAPCLLVLEDLDALLTPYNRSFFLNELDGFDINTGVVALATTNHPERLDPAILDRPSRFDRKYPFDLPALAERRAYIALWNASLRPALRLDEGATDRLAEATDGFSFAYLKELFLAAMMRWIAAPEPGAMGRVLTEQAATLRAQMVSALAAPAPEPGGDAPPDGPPGYRVGMMRPDIIRRGGPGV